MADEKVADTNKKAIGKLLKESSIPPTAPVERPKATVSDVKKDKKTVND